MSHKVSNNHLVLTSEWKVNNLKQLMLIKITYRSISILCYQNTASTGWTPQFVFCFFVKFFFILYLLKCCTGANPYWNISLERTPFRTLSLFLPKKCQCFKDTATTLDTTLITAYIFFSWKKYLADLGTFLLSNLLMHILWKVKDST